MNYYDKYVKYKHKYLKLKGGALSNCINYELIEKDCLDDVYLKSIYEKNIIYQNTLTKLDRFIIWFYTKDSAFINNFLRDKRNILI